MNSNKAFAGISEKYSKPDTSKIVLLSIPYIGEHTKQTDADKGFDAFIEASQNIELYDIETDSEAYKNGIYQPEAITENNSPEATIKTIHKTVKSHITRNKFVTIFGGDHTISKGTIKAFNECFSNLTVLHFGAHADLRKEYKGSVYNHACALYEASQETNLIQVGLRSMDVSEKSIINYDNVFFAHEIIYDEYWMDNAIELMTPNVYITLDLDVLDPSIMPSTGTPEPGGLLYNEILDFLKKVFEQKNVVGFDMVELCPNPINKAPNFLTAKLYYKMLSYKFNNEAEIDNFDEDFNEEDDTNFGKPSKFKDNDNF